MPTSAVVYDLGETQALVADDYWLGTDGELLTTAAAVSWHERDPFFPTTFYGAFLNDTTGTTAVVIEESENKSDVRKSTTLSAAGLDDGVTHAFQYPYFRVKITVATDDTNLAYFIIPQNRSGR
jgi:hypothetical protein